MIGLIMLAAAALAFGRQAWLFSQYQNFESRRRLSGCEVARQVLDLRGCPQVSVQPVKTTQSGPSAQEILLEETHYEGTSLLDAAASARLAVEGPALAFRHILKALVVPAWIAVLLGIIPALEFISAAGQIFLAVVFIFGVLDYMRGFDSRREILELLKQTGCYEPDELVKLRRLLRALQLEGLAQIVKVPYELVSGFAQRKSSRS